MITYYILVENTREDKERVQQALFDAGYQWINSIDSREIIYKPMTGIAIHSDIMRLQFSDRIFSHANKHGWKEAKINQLDNLDLVDRLEEVSEISLD